MALTVFSVVWVGLKYTAQTVLDHLVAKSYSVTYGARNLRRTIQKEIEEPMASAIIASYAHPITQVKVTVEDDAIKLYTM